MKKILVLSLMSLSFIGCGRFGNKEGDDKKDMRIVCLSKHLTEMVFALGKGHDLVAVDLSETFKTAMILSHSLECPEQCY